MDVPNKVAIIFLYDLPQVKWSSHFAKDALNGWEWSGSFLYESGQPVTIQSGTDSNGNGDSAGDRAVLNPSGTEGVGSLVNPVCRNPATGATSINPACTPPNTVGYAAVNPNAKYIQAGPGSRREFGPRLVQIAASQRLEYGAAQK